MDCPDWNEIPALELLSPPELVSKRVRLDTSSGELFLEVLDDGFRLFTPNAHHRAQDYELLTVQPSAVDVVLEQFDGLSILVSNNCRLELTHRPLAFRLLDGAGRCCIGSPTDGHFVRKHRVPPFAKTEKGWWVSIELSSGEPVYGLGEKWGALNKRGQLLRSYNSDALGVNAEISYKNTPFCWSPSGWAVFNHTPAPVTHAVGEPSWSQRSYCALVEDDELDLFIFRCKPSSRENNAGAALIERYTELTGRAPLPPIWSTGVILSKAYYQDAQEILSVARTVRENNMPCDTITFDGRAWQDTETRFSFTWSPSRYPNPKAVIDELKELDFKVCVWEYPLVSTRGPLFNELADKGWLLTDKRTSKAYEYEWDMQAFGEVLTPLPRSGIIDFTNPEAYQFWHDSHQALFDIGVDMIKADFGEQITDDNMLASNGESGHALHNVYSHLYNRCVYQAAETFSPSGPFLFSRASWIGCQRFNSHWGGDPQADWEGLISNLRGGLSWGLSGSPFYATDVGGFYKDTRDDNLYVRWAQAAVFSAHYRLHGIGDREPWSYSQSANLAVSKALQLRYQLLAYLYDAMRQSHESGLPVQRPMVIAFPEEPQSWGFENQFMFGDEMLVVPCFDPEGYVEFYLPAGKWCVFDPNSVDAGTNLDGLQVHRRQLALDEMAVFVRQGRSIGLSPQVEHTAQFNLDSQNPVIPIERTWIAK